MAKPTKAAPPRAPPDRSNGVSLWKGLVRIEGKFAKKVENRIETVKFIQEIYESIRSNADPNFRMGDKEGNMFSMDGIPETYDACIEMFNLKVIDKGNHQHLMFVMTFESAKLIGNLKSACFPVLKRHNLYMHPHPFPAEKLDVGSAGFILGANARLHSPQEQKARIRNVLFQWWLDQPIESIAQWKERFQSDKEGTDIIPDFFVSAKVAKGRDVAGRETASASAFLVMTHTKRINAFSSLMETVFAPPDGDEPPAIKHDIKFVPARFQRFELSLYANLVKQQQLYLNNYGSVSVAGLCRERMYKTVTIHDPRNGSDQTATVHAALMNHPHVHRIDPAGSVATLGKWNIETTKEHLEEVKSHIDKVIDLLPVDVKECTGFKYFPNVTRMKAARQLTEAANKYAHWIKPLSATEEASVLTPGTNVSATSNRVFSQNPQEPEVPSLLHFPSVNESHGQPQTYAQSVRQRGHTPYPSPYGKTPSTYGNTPSPYGKTHPMSTTKYTKPTKEMEELIKAHNTPPEPVRDPDHYMRMINCGVEEAYERLDHKLSKEMEELKASLAPLVSQATATLLSPTGHGDNNQDSSMSNPEEPTENAEVDDSLKSLLIEFMENAKQNTADLKTSLQSLGDKHNSLNNDVADVVTTVRSIGSDLGRLNTTQDALILRIERLESARSDRMTADKARRTRKKRSHPEGDEQDPAGYATAKEESSDEQDSEHEVHRSPYETMRALTVSTGDTAMEDINDSSADEDDQSMDKIPAEGHSAWHP
eukprot:scaffold1377_cov126-Cylindrotheca_fusiformis.AAC.10